MLEIDAKVVLPGEVPAVERHVCIRVGGGDVIWVRHVWIHYKTEAKIEEMSEEREFGDASYLATFACWKIDGFHIFLPRRGLPAGLEPMTREC